jgi:hypothetical protein
MPHRECPPDEDVLRAILTAHWDERKNRLSSSLFSGTGTSVSRLSILGLADLFTIFHQELAAPPRSQVIGGGEIILESFNKLAEPMNPSRRL